MALSVTDIAYTILLMVTCLEYHLLTNLIKFQHKTKPDRVDVLRDEHFTKEKRIIMGYVVAIFVFCTMNFFQFTVSLFLMLTQ